MKRANGQGTVYKLSGKNRRRPWVARASNKGVIIGYFKKRPDAEQALLTYNKAPTDKVRILWGELHDEWQTSKYYRELSKSMKQTYSAAWNYVESLKNRPLVELRTSELQDAIDSCNRSVRVKEDIKMLCRAMYRYAMQEDMIHKNYGEFLIVPKREDVESDCFTDVEIKKVNKAAENGVPNAELILMMIYTGFRIGAFLTLDKLSYRDGCLIGGSKTAAGRNRIVPIHKCIEKYVAKWAAKKGQTLICKPDGTPYTVNHFRDSVYYPALEDIGIRKLTPHKCRHTFITLMAKADVEDTARLKLAGHTSKAMTMRYTKHDIEMLRKAIDAM